MSDFESRLSDAVERGQKRRADKVEAEQRRKMTQEQLKSLHSKYRLQVSEHIEEHLKKIPDHFPGFQYEAVFGEKGWGAACSRDDFRSGNNRQRDNHYSRLELTVKPYSDLAVLELNGKATIRNKELFNRTFFEEIPDADPQEFLQRIDYWIIEFAEVYSASN